MPLYKYEIADGRNMDGGDFANRKKMLNRFTKSAMQREYIGYEVKQTKCLVTDLLHFFVLVY